MTVTLVQATAAPAGAQQQRWALRHLLCVDEAIASADDLALAARVKSAATPDAYDTFAQMQDVIDLFRRRVLYFGDARWLSLSTR